MSAYESSVIDPSLSYNAIVYSYYSEIKFIDLIGCINVFYMECNFLMLSTFTPDK